MPVDNLLPGEGVYGTMSTWEQQNLHKHMSVFSSDNLDLGRVAEVYEDSFLVHERPLFSRKRYFPYEMIKAVDQEGVHLRLSAEEAQVPEWEKRPDYEDHLGDPTQLFYDRGHGVHDPFDETNPNNT